MKFEIDTGKIVDNTVSEVLEKKINGKTLKQWMVEIAKHQWISVKDRLPDEHDSLFANRPHLSKQMWAKESDSVIVYVRFPDGTGRVTEGRLQDGKWWTRIPLSLEPTVTHWMPMPEAPKDGDGNAR
jgi:hypothetical protein